MDCFAYRDGELYAEEVAVSRLAADFGTPTYIYSRAAIEAQWQAFDQAFAGHPHLICYAVKANGNLAVLNVLARLGAGFDIVSRGELERVLTAGGEPSRVIFSGVGKRADEIVQALQVGIRCFNVESAAELELLARLAGEQGTVAPVALRINPDVDAGTHPYIATGLRDNKFGIAIDQALAIYQRAAALPSVRISGLDCHIGSQLTRSTPYVDALQRLLRLVDALAANGIVLDHLDLGGGLGIRYRDELPPTPVEQAGALLGQLAGRECELILEPGRAIVGNAGILLTRVELLKHTAAKNFAVVDAAMNDMLRPALYSAWQNIIPVRPRPDVTRAYDVVGPVCESADFLGKDRQLALVAGDLLAVCSAGAYGFVMSSNYNSRPRAAEVMVDGERAFEVRRRETLTELYAGESLLP